MSRVRFNFLNWRPDQEDFGNDGLTVATNIVHDSEGWKPVHLASAGSFSTTGGLTTVTSIVAKPVGTQGDVLCAWVNGTTLHIGLNGQTATSTTTGYPVSFATAGSNAAITAFDVCEIEDSVYFVAEAKQNTAIPNTTTSITTSGYFSI